MKKSTVFRSDHLQAIIDYALHQAVMNDIAVLDWGDNQNALNSEEQLEEIQRLSDDIKEMIATSGHRELTIK